MRQGLITGATYGAATTAYTKQEIQFMKSRVYESERLDIAGVPNMVKDLILGIQNDPEFSIRFQAIEALSREIWA